MMISWAGLFGAACVASVAQGLAPMQERRQFLQSAAVSIAAVPGLASANIAGANSNSLNLRISDKITAPEGGVRADVELPTAEREALAAGATAYGAIGASFLAEEGEGSDKVQRYFGKDGEYEILVRSVSSIVGDGAVPKGVRKAGSAFLAATAATRESYNTGAFDKAAEQYEFALGILVGFCARVGVVSDGAATGGAAPRPKAEPVTRRTYLPGPFQLL